MTAANPIIQTISEPLTWEQICKRYPNEWVCLVEIDRPEPQNFEFSTARVVGHGKTRRAPLLQARPWREQYKTIGHYFTEHLEPEVHRPICFIRIDIPMGMPLFLPCSEAEAEAFASRARPKSQQGGEP